MSKRKPKAVGTPRDFTAADGMNNGSGGPDLSWKTIPNPDPEPGTIKTILFKPDGEQQAPGARTADIRAFLMRQIGRDALAATKPDPINRHVAVLNFAAASALADGHCFDIATSCEVLDGERLPREDFQTLRVPFPRTVVTAQIDEMPMLFALESDDQGRLRQSLVMGLSVTSQDPKPRLSPIALLVYRPMGGGADGLILGGSMAKDVLDRLNFFSILTRKMLRFINDDRFPADNVVPGVKLNRSRAKSGKPPLPPLWKIDARKAPDSYVTRLTGASQGTGKTGQGIKHSPPCPHDRRGHRRRLPSGKAVFVRACRVGAEERHMTRSRAYYTLAATPTRNA